MKSLKSLATALIIIVSGNVFASDSVNSSTPEKRYIAAPVFTWGTPEDLDARELEALKVNPFAHIAAPEFIWGAAEDLNESELNSLKVVKAVLSLPNFTWGSAEDLDEESIATLKVRPLTIAFPAHVIGNPNEIDVIGLK